ncbi:hypothetical protein M378DRAFT_14938 [Amanita muscaria Koide BX008]|uniref:Nephrocystin 3-like N-terminal domain-containing protein n=1 Tax=Amanita muscaria (strain Koide BX008) TaxID=946122 RepID=A0A0C2S8V0_AMAMK|nr:hypothetical protein M378DRAFT_14938 [Amanita muscaria Koide BX008]
MALFSRNPDSRSNPAPSGAGSQHLIQSTYKWFKLSVLRLFRRSRHHDTMPQAPGVGITTLGSRQGVDGHEQQTSGDISNDVSRASAAPNMQAEYRNTFPNIAEPVTFPIATQFQGAQGFNISGQPRFTNNVTTDGGTHGLENMEYFVSFAAFHASAEQLQDPKGHCNPGTRRYVLSRLRDWFDNPNPTHRICWLHGPAGAGKSAIAQTIADEYKERGVAATFFFYRSDPSRNDGNRLFPTIAWQLAFSIPAIKDFIVHALNKTPHLPRKNVESQFEELVAHPFHPTNNIASQMPQLAPVVIIDGVDECSDKRLLRRILAVIGNAVKDCRVPLHFLICSTPEALIEEVLDQFKDFTLRIDLATLDDSNRDIEK